MISVFCTRVGPIMKKMIKNQKKLDIISIVCYKLFSESFKFNNIRKSQEVMSMDGGPSSMFTICERAISKLSVITKGRVRSLLASSMPFPS